MIHMLIGIQGSGKSTYASLLALDLNCEIVSTDFIRKSNPGIKEKDVLSIVYETSIKYLNEQKSIIFDATNITSNVRSRYIQEIKKYFKNINISAYYFKTDVNLCYKRIVERNKIDDELYLTPLVVYSFNKKLIMPTLDEGFMFIKIIENGKVIKEINKEI